MNGPWVKVQPFIREVLGNKRGMSGGYATKTKGWAEEKENRKNKISAFIEKKDIEKSANEALEALNAVRTEVYKRVTAEVVGKVSVRDLETLWTIIRVENGMPTTINKNENRNHDEDKKESEKLLELFKNIDKDAHSKRSPVSTNARGA